MKQIDFIVDAPYQAHSETSRLAAQEIDPQLGRLQYRVLAFLRTMDAYGATDDEMQVALDMNPSTQRPRRIELVAKGLVIDMGPRRKTRSGRMASVWIANEKPT
jgi:hypothetical protein